MKTTTTASTRRSPPERSHATSSTTFDNNSDTWRSQQTNQDRSLNETDFFRYLGSCPDGTAERVRKVPEVIDPWLPWAAEQLRALAELAGVARDSDLYEAASPWYLLLSSHYMLHDAAVDESATDVDQILSSADAMTLVWWSFEADVAQHLRTDILDATRRQMLSRLAERNGSLLIERERKRTWDPPDERDRLAAIGRNNSTILAYEALCASTSQPPSGRVIDAVGQLVYLMQLGDDLGDWVHDFANGNNTMFLRWCATQSGRAASETFDAMQRAILLDGFYERYVGRLICDFDVLRDDFVASGAPCTDGAVAYVDSARAKALALLRDRVSTKLAFVDAD